LTETTLITFPPSLDSEFGRFLLSHYGIAHREERHTLVFSSFVTLRRGRTVRFPLLHDGSLRLNTVAKMVDHLEATCAPSQRLRPGAVASREARGDWTLFHKTLSTAATVFAYYHLLPHRDIMVGPLSEGVPRLEVEAVRRGYPFFATLLRLLLWLTARREQQAVRTIAQVMQTIDTQLADGRRYLRNDTFTLSDMAFAVAAAPLVWPDEYGGAVPTLDETPPPLRALIEDTRQRPAGALALRIFRDHRGVRSSE
jgi:glutathione S-transferase